MSVAMASRAVVNIESQGCHGDNRVTIETVLVLMKSKKGSEGNFEFVST